MGGFDFEALKAALSGLVDELEPAPCAPQECAEWETVCFDGAEPDNSGWRALLEKHTESAKTFEIHCWSDETAEIALALEYGAVKKSRWRHGTIVEGAVTPELRTLLLTLPKPAAADGYNKMTPFFTVIFDNGFSSEHYGTENHIKKT